MPNIAAAPSIASQGRTLSEAEEEHSKHALTVAIATAAAAEAAVAAAEAAAEVVRLTGTPESLHQCEREKGEDSPIEIKIDAPQLTNQYERKIQELAAIKIQTAFRGYLVNSFEPFFLQYGNALSFSIRSFGIRFLNCLYITKFW